MIDGILSAGQAVPAIGALFTVLKDMKHHLDGFVESEQECKRLSIWCVSQIGTLGHLGKEATIDQSTVKLLRAAIPPLLDLKKLVISRRESSSGYLGKMMAFWTSTEYLRKSDMRRSACRRPLMRSSPASRSTHRLMCKTYSKNARFCRP